MSHPLQTALLGLQEYFNVSAFSESMVNFCPFTSLLHEAVKGDDACQ